MNVKVHAGACGRFYRFATSDEAAQLTTACACMKSKRFPHTEYEAAALTVRTMEPPGGIIPGTTVQRQNEGQGEVRVRVSLSVTVGVSAMVLVVKARMGAMKR